MYKCIYFRQYTCCTAETMVCQEKLKTNMQIMIPDIPDGVWNISSTPDKRNRKGIEKE
jgi:hypothetical protein